MAMAARRVPDVKQVILVMSERSAKALDAVIKDALPRIKYKRMKSEETDALLKEIHVEIKSQLTGEK